MSIPSASTSVDRRGFLKSSAALAAGTAIAATAPRFLSAAERTRSIGILGGGGRPVRRSSRWLSCVRSPALSMRSARVR